MIGKRTVTLVISFLAGMLPPLAAVDFSVRARPYVSIPFGAGVNLYTIGGGADITFDVDISSLLRNPLNLGYSLGPEVGMNFIPLNQAESVMQVLSGGLQAGLFYYPFSRLNIRASASAGIYQASRNSLTTLNLWYKFSGEIGFRFSPNFIVSAHGGYRQNNYRKDDPLYSGVFAGLTAQLQFTSSASRNSIAVEMIQDSPVYPIFMGLYRDNPIGTLRVTNNESAEIRNVSVSFRAGSYTASLYPCGTIPLLGKGRTAEIPLYADFAPFLLNISENIRIPGELIIEYRILGTPRSAAGTALVSVLNRNNFQWNDPASLAVFISPTAPEVLDYTKYVIGIARNRQRTGLNERMQYAMFLFEGMRSGNIHDSEDQETPYIFYHVNPELVDYIQFPFQTLAYRSGGIDDLGLLFAASLEAAGIPAALVPLTDDFIVACNLGISEASAVNYFENLDNLLVINDEVWMPLAFSNFREGFINSWYNAVNKINYAVNSGEDIQFIILQEAWADYPPANLPAQDIQFNKPPEEGMAALVETGMMRYIAEEYTPKIQRVFAEIQTTGGSAALFNQLGLLYVRAGMMEQAIIEYQRSAALGSVSGMVNLGNIAMLAKDYTVAEQWFALALQNDPDNQTARNSLNQIIAIREE
jgi:tetratricopeptide (TPR) repeat protein